MVAQHLILVFWWIGYCFIHSLLASTACKSFFKTISGNFFRYYRLAYTIFAVITLALLLYYQFSIQSPQLLHSRPMKYLALTTLAIPGLVLMLLSIYKYFKLLSGVESLFIPKPTPQLKIDGIHRHTRHPLYLGTLLFIWGMLFVFPLLSNFMVVCVLSLYICIGINLEEKKLISEFGQTYINYQLNVPMLVPGFRRLPHEKR